MYHLDRYNYLHFRGMSTNDHCFIICLFSFMYCLSLFCVVLFYYYFSPVSMFLISLSSFFLSLSLSLSHLLLLGCCRCRCGCCLPTLAGAGGPCSGPHSGTVPIWGRHPAVCPAPICPSHRLGRSLRSSSLLECKRQTLLLATSPAPPLPPPHICVSAPCYLPSLSLSLYYHCPLLHLMP